MDRRVPWLLALTALAAAMLLLPGEEADRPAPDGPPPEGDRYHVGSYGGYEVSWSEAATNTTTGQRVHFAFRVEGPEPVPSMSFWAGRVSVPDGGNVTRYEEEVGRLADVPVPIVHRERFTFDLPGTYYVRGHVHIEGKDHLVTPEATILVGP